jgi:hypothetical protein
MNKNNNRLWLAIIWFAVWGIFQAYAIISILNGNWKRPEAFQVEAYNALVYPDIFIIPFYFLTSVLLYRSHYLGNVFGLLSGGAVIYIMIYLLALADFKGVINITFDSLFLTVNTLAVFQIIRDIKSKINNRT